MTKARDIADFKFEDIVDTGTEGTKVASGTTAERGSTAGQIRFNSETGLAEYYTGTAFKSIDAPPTVSSLDVTEVDSQAGGNQTIVITGSGFASGATVTFVGASGTDFNASTVIVDSDTQITAVAPKASFLNAQEPYGVKITNISGLSNTLSGQINVDTAPSFDIASGSLGTLEDLDRASSNLTTITASDPDGDTITFTVQSGSLPTGITLNSDGTFSGTANSVASSTTFTFTVRATANSKTSDREFSITMNPPLFSNADTVDTSVSGYTIYAYTTSGSNITANLLTNKTADILMVAGGGAGGYVRGNNDMGKGGGGAGQVLFKTGHSLTAGSYTFYIGDGGAGRDNGDGTIPTFVPSGEDTTAFGLTAKGGGNGGANDGGAQAGQGGSAGGQGARDGNSTTRITSNKTTPSGWTSYGNSGGTSQDGNYSGGGGGGATGQGGDQSGSANSASSQGGSGGAGVNMSSTFGTNFGENGYFAGGGGGGTYRSYNTASVYRASGGIGGGGDGVYSNDSGHSPYNWESTNRDGLVNTGGGGGGGAEDGDLIANRGSASGAGGSGIILIRVAN